jgi:transcriptional regulator of arginine metabolism
MQIPGIVGSIAGDDTIMCAVRTMEETTEIMAQLRKIIEQK